MALSSEQKTPIYLILIAVLVAGMAYTGEGVKLLLSDFGGLKGQAAHVQAVRDTIATLTAQTDSAKRELARGTVEDLRKRLDGYRASLALMRRLVPDRNEVPNLLDDISTRAKIRGVNLSAVVPMAEEAGPAPFNTSKYQMQVIGHYDQIGQFLADIASLPRIIVPYDVTVAAAQAASAKALGDTSGALLEAKFQIRTYVKSANGDDQEADSGT